MLGYPVHASIVPIPASGPPWAIADVTGLTAALAGKQATPVPISDVTGLQAALDARATNLMSLVTVSGTTKTFALSDAFTKQECTNGSAVTLTIPLNATVAFVVGTWLGLSQIGAGQLTVAATGGVTLQSESSMVKTAAQFTDLWLLKRATNTWLLTGRLTA